MSRAIVYKKFTRRSTFLISLFALTALFVLPNGFMSFLQPTARAATTFTVNSTGDGADANAGDGICADSSGSCTLRASIQEANALAGDDTINITVTGTINLTGALPDLSTNLAVNGPGANILGVRRDTGGAYRVFTVAAGASVQISGLSVTNGRSPDGLDGALGDAANGQDGGGIYNSGTLTLTAVAISGNQTGKGGSAGIDSGTDGNGGRGGGLFNAGTVSLLNCTVDGNMTSRSGVGDVGSKGGDGGGIANLGTLTLVNSTVSGNHAAGSRIGGDGGAIFTNGSATITACTITANSAGGSFHDSLGGGIRASGGTTTLRSTIVAGNADTGAGTPDLSGAFNSEGFNLIQSTSGATINETANSGTNITGLNPRLGPLADNGGPTLTHALLGDSPALEAGDDSVLGSPLNLSTDQRGTGFPRRVNAHVDIGAFEFNGRVSTIQFTASALTVNEGAGAINVTVTRTGDLSADGLSVDYETSDGSASGRSDYTDAFGTLHFGQGESSKTFSVFITDDAFIEGEETFTIKLSNPRGDAAIGARATTTVTISDNDNANSNPIDDAQFFVRQHYHDFLNREPDAEGFAFWTNEITSCGTDAQCREVKRVNVSAAFFLSIEFQETGYFVYRTYKSAYGNSIGTSTFPNTHTLSVPVIRFQEFLRGTQKVGQAIVVGVGDWQTQLENNKRAFTLEFVQEQRFKNAFPPSMTPAQFVDQLRANTGSALSQSERDQLVSELSADNTDAGRAGVLRKVAEDSDLVRNETNSAFVLMQFFGYLRRNPNDTPDADYTGYDFWLKKLDQFGGNFIRAEMVRGFISSTEYRHRFGQ
jgi:CSLREA domain-containing protein